MKESLTVCYYTSKIEKNLLFKIPRYELQYKYLKDLVPNIVLTVVLAYNESNSPLLYTRVSVNTILPVSNNNTRLVLHKDYCEKLNCKNNRWTL